jgi:hypothetical protein
MKKYIVPTVVIALAAVMILVRYAIAAPARVAARNLEAINGITVGQTSEAELLGRDAFQKADRRCFEAECFYHMETENKFLNSLHLAPRTHMSTAVSVRNGMVTGVRVFTMKWGLPPISLQQVLKMPPECSSNPCARRLVPPTKVLASISVAFTRDAVMRNQMPEIVNAQCFSRLHGCNTYAELLPGTKTLNLDAIAALK